MTPQERADLLLGNIESYFNQQVEVDDTQIFLLSYLASQVDDPNLDDAQRSALETQIDNVNIAITEGAARTHKQALEDVNQEDVIQLMEDTLYGIQREYFRTTGLYVPAEQQELILDSIASNILSLTPVNISTTIALVGGPDEFAYNPVLENIVQQSINKSQTTVERFPTAFSEDVQIGLIAEQMIQAGIINQSDIATAERNIEANLDTILRQLDEVSSENEKNFSNIADKLINQAIADPVTEAQTREYAKFAWLNDIGDPQLLGANQAQSTKQIEILSRFEGEGYIENAGADFKKRMENLYPIDENDPYKTQKQAALKNKIAEANRAIALIQQDEGNLLDKTEGIRTILKDLEQGNAEQNILSIEDTYNVIAQQEQFTQLDQQLKDQRDEINKNPQSFQQQYMQADSRERADFDSMLEAQSMFGYGVTPSGEVREIPQFDTSTISDPSARAAMEQFMAYTQGLTPEQQFDMQLGGMPPSLPQNVMEGFEAIRPAKEGYTPIMDEQGNWTGDVLPLYPYGTSEEEKQTMIDDYRRQTTKQLPKTKMTPGVDYSLSIDEMENDKGFRTPYTLTPEGGLDQKDVGTVGLGKSFQEPDLMYQTEDFDLAPPAKPKVKTQEFDARF